MGERGWNERASAQTKLDVPFLWEPRWDTYIGRAGFRRGGSSIGLVAARSNAKVGRA